MHFSDLSNGLAGQLLIASPFITAPPFAQTVIFLCAYSPQEGAMGIIVNRHLTKPTPEELLQQLGIAPIPPDAAFSVSAGGPVENAHGLVLHSTDWETNGCIPVTDKVLLNASLDVLRDLSIGKGPKYSLLALGHASWAPGQLEEELKNSIWHIAPCHEEMLFSPHYTQKWRNALHSISIDPGKLSYFIGKS
ncbi:YqgE/AlgH family protein [Commensalibacter nepenthis]|uniref:UPF0301 protein QJV33_01305 n=1 Tax=Commensalibacter nepenthis TaxID=3043872 RepID=A0ABT6Q4V7_9PROT|nr:YqgE/AlgH family protein [Commensalibacter sp. TBRC 10068]MDI2111939.1 YqgE/AlgH family protein [Commensalibacter sp. TBRC 10068]